MGFVGWLTLRVLMNLICQSNRFNNAGFNINGGFRSVAISGGTMKFDVFDTA